MHLNLLDKVLAEHKKRKIKRASNRFFISLLSVMLLTPIFLSGLIQTGNLIFLALTCFSISTCLGFKVWQWHLEEKYADILLATQHTSA